MSKHVINLTFYYDPELSDDGEWSALLESGLEYELTAVARQHGYERTDDLRPAAVYKSALRALVGAIKGMIIHWPPPEAVALAVAYDRALALLSGVMPSTSIDRPEQASKVGRCTRTAMDRTGEACGGPVVEGVCRRCDREPWSKPDPIRRLEGAVDVPAPIDPAEVSRACRDYLKHPNELGATQALCAALHVRECCAGEWVPTGLADAVRELFGQWTSPMDGAAEWAELHLEQVRRLLGQIGTRDAIDGSETDRRIEPPLEEPECSVCSDTGVDHDVAGRPYRCACTPGPKYFDR